MSTPPRPPRPTQTLNPAHPRVIPLPRRSAPVLKRSDNDRRIPVARPNSSPISARQRVGMKYGVALPLQAVTQQRQTSPSCSDVSSSALVGVSSPSNASTFDPPTSAGGKASDTDASAKKSSESNLPDRPEPRNSLNGNLTNVQVKAAYRIRNGGYTRRRDTPLDMKMVFARTAAVAAREAEDSRRIAGAGAVVFPDISDISTPQVVDDNGGEKDAVGNNIADCNKGDGGANAETAAPTDPDTHSASQATPPMLPTTAPPPLNLNEPHSLGSNSECSVSAPGGPLERVLSTRPETVATHNNNAKTPATVKVGGGESDTESDGKRGHKRRSVMRRLSAMVTPRSREAESATNSHSHSAWVRSSTTTGGRMRSRASRLLGGGGRAYEPGQAVSCLADQMSARESEGDKRKPRSWREWAVGDKETEEGWSDGEVRSGESSWQASCEGLSVQSDSVMERRRNVSEPAMHRNR